MKKIILILLFVLIANSSFSQETNPSPPITKQDYLQKSKNQKTTAWIMLSSGSVVGLVGLTKLNLAGTDNGEVNNTPGTVLFFTGIAAAITSIPVFSASKRNRKKAISLSFKKESIPQLQKNNFIHGTTHSLNVKFSL